MRNFKISRRFCAFIFFALANAAVFSILRFIFYIANKPAEAIASNLISRAFAVGARFDLRTAFLYALPVGILFLLPYKKWYKKTFAALYAFAFGVFILLYMVDFGYYAYLGERLNAYIFALGAEGGTSLEMLLQTYPVAKCAALLLAAAAFYFWLMLKFLSRVFAKDEPKKNYWYALPALLIAAAFVHGRFSQYPLRWSNAYFNPNIFVSSLALNPAQNLFDTYGFAKKGAGFDAEKTRGYYDVVADYLGVKNKDKQNLNFTREIPAAKGGVKNYNIVVILTESLAYDKTSFNAPEIDPTPQLSALANRGLLFKNFFTPTTGTARGVFTSITGLPDTSANETASRNPHIVRQHTLINDLQGYKKFYFIGGSANWGNVRGLLQNNIEGLEIIEEGGYKGMARTDVWGVSDLDMLRYAAAKLKKTQKPFFAFLQTAGYHRPYTIPKDRGSFELENIDDAALQPYGFSGAAEYNSMRFQDYAIGEFFRLIENEDFYKNTVFFIYGDHGLHAKQSKNSPKALMDLSLEENNVPLLIIGPGVIQGVSDRAASQADITATMAGLLGVAYNDTAIGRNIFDESLEEGAFILSSGKAPLRYGFVQGGFYYTQWPGRQGMFKYTGVDAQTDYCPQLPRQCERMKALADGLYETARYITFRHNSVIAAAQSPKKGG
ncbi:MAG: LTA synthase family protein [Elusimicrobiota bacterium]|jgi:phosphoglycerol transferase MdoB-like AlkP superfamily enzyme|nr:LTA synthase family protein [Elusimicrobiota bacterium]